jgi:hypothetical protein
MSAYRNAPMSVSRDRGQWEIEPIAGCAIVAGAHEATLIHDSDEAGREEFP